MDTTQQIVETTFTTPDKNPQGIEMHHPRRIGPRQGTITDLGVKRPLHVKGISLRRRERDAERSREGCGHQRSRQTQDEAPIHEVDTIFEGPYVGGETRNAKRNYAHEAKHLPLTSYIVGHNSRRDQVLPIVFTQEDTEGVHYPHRDALV